MIYKKISITYNKDKAYDFKANTIGYLVGY